MSAPKVYSEMLSSIHSKSKIYENGHENETHNVMYE